MESTVALVDNSMDYEKLVAEVQSIDCTHIMNAIVHYKKEGSKNDFQKGYLLWKLYTEQYKNPVWGTVPLWVMCLTEEDIASNKCRTPLKLTWSWQLFCEYKLSSVGTLSTVFSYIRYYELCKIIYEHPMVKAAGLTSILHKTLLSEFRKSDIITKGGAAKTDKKKSKATNNNVESLADREKEVLCRGILAIHKLHTMNNVNPEIDGWNENLVKFFGKWYGSILKSGERAWLWDAPIEHVTVDAIIDRFTSYARKRELDGLDPKNKIPDPTTDIKGLRDIEPTPFTKERFYTIYGTTLDNDVRMLRDYINMDPQVLEHKEIIVSAYAFMAAYQLTKFTISCAPVDGDDQQLVEEWLNLKTNAQSIMNLMVQTSVNQATAPLTFDYMAVITQAFTEFEKYVPLLIRNATARKEARTARETQAKKEVQVANKAKSKSSKAKTAEAQAQQQPPQPQAAKQPPKASWPCCLCKLHTDKQVHPLSNGNPNCAHHAHNTCLEIYYGVVYMTEAPNHVGQSNWETASIIVSCPECGYSHYDQTNLIPVQLLQQCYEKHKSECGNFGTKNTNTEMDELVDCWDWSGSKLHEANEEFKRKSAQSSQETTVPEPQEEEEPFKMAEPGVSKIVTIADEVVYTVKTTTQIGTGTTAAPEAASSTPAIEEPIKPAKCVDAATQQGDLVVVEKPTQAPAPEPVGEGVQSKPTEQAATQDTEFLKLVTAAMSKNVADTVETPKEPEKASEPVAATVEATVPRDPSKPTNEGVDFRSFVWPDPPKSADKPATEQVAPQEPEKPREKTQAKSKGKTKQKPTESTDELPELGVMRCELAKKRFVPNGLYWNNKKEVCVCGEHAKEEATSSSEYSPLSIDGMADFVTSDLQLPICYICTQEKNGKFTPEAVRNLLKALKNIDADQVINDKKAELAQKEKEKQDKVNKENQEYVAKMKEQKTAQEKPKSANKPVVHKPRQATKETQAILIKTFAKMKPKRLCAPLKPALSFVSEFLYFNEDAGSTETRCGAHIEYKTHVQWNKDNSVYWGAEQVMDTYYNNDGQIVHCLGCTEEGETQPSNIFFEANMRLFAENRAKESAALNVIAITPVSSAKSSTEQEPVQEQTEPEAEEQEEEETHKNDKKSKKSKKDKKRKAKEVEEEETSESSGNKNSNDEEEQQQVEEEPEEQPEPEPEPPKSKKSKKGKKEKPIVEEKDSADPEAQSKVVPAVKRFWRHAEPKIKAALEGVKGQILAAINLRALPEEKDELFDFAETDWISDLIKNAVDNKYANIKLDHQIKTLTEEVEELRKCNATQKALIQTLESQVAKDAELRESGEVLIKELQQLKEIADGDLAKLEDQVKAERVKHAQEIAAKNSKLERLEKELDGKTEELESVKAEYAELKEEMEKMQSKFGIVSIDKKDDASDEDKVATETVQEPAQETQVATKKRRGRPPSNKNKKAKV